MAHGDHSRGYRRLLLTCLSEPIGSRKLAIMRERFGVGKGDPF